MSYQPYLIASYSTGLDKELQPWLLPDDAQHELFDGFVYRGVWQKRQGYNYFATGEQNGVAYTESRMVRQVTNQAPATGAIDGLNTVFTFTLTTPVRRGGVVITGNNPAQVLTDDGIGGFTGDVGVGTNTINYLTGAVTVTFAAAPIVASTVLATYTYFPDQPVMMVANYFTATGTRQLIVADLQFVNRYNTTTNRLDDISPTVLLSGDNTKFFSWTNYEDPNDQKRLLFVNYTNPIQQYSGGAVTPYPVFTNSAQITAAASGVVGDGTAGPYTINTPANTGIVPGTLSILEPTTPQTVTDNQFGVLEGQGTGTVNYLTGAIVVTFSGAVLVGDPINLTYMQMNTPIETCLHLKNFKDRLILLSTIEGGARKNLRIRVSGTGAFCDTFTQDATGAGFIDIPDQTYIVSTDFNRDDLLIQTQSCWWALKYTNNDTRPFVLYKLDDSRGSDAPFSGITYLNRTSAASRRGLLVSDGYKVERNDDNLPDFSYNEVDQDRFTQCFAGTVDEDRDHYLIYPTQNQDTSKRILVTNYEEDNFAIYRLPLSCMGNYLESFDITWNDLLKYDNWDQMATDYGSWNSFSYMKGTPIAIGGGLHGEIWRLNLDQSEDNPVHIRAITYPDSVNTPNLIDVETDWNNYTAGDAAANIPADVIFFEGIEGLTEINDKQFAIDSIITPFRVFRIDKETYGTQVYTANTGIASRVIPFESTTKNFNPFVNADKKVRCGWLYMYVSSTSTSLTELDEEGQEATVPAKITIEVYTNDSTMPSQILDFNVSPYQGNPTNLSTQIGEKKWTKLWINQTARFIQFKVKNQQAGADIKIHAMMPGFQAVGRLL